MKIIKTHCTYIPEMLRSPFGFKGGFLRQLWQVVCHVQTQNHHGTGVGVQSVLWADATVFAANSEDTGNQYMYDVTAYALSLLEGKEGTTPMELIDAIYPNVLSYAKGLTNVGKDLRETFVRNALVPVDNALWQLYANERGCQDLLALIPAEFTAPLQGKQKTLCNIPLISYGVTEKEIRTLLDNGTVLLKVKIGFDDNGAMTKEEMLAWDMQRLCLIHDIAKEYQTAYTVSGNILYYLDANGKYDTVDRLQKLLDYAGKIGALERIVLLEEPFEEHNKVNVAGLPVRIAADESVHSLADVEERIALGYQAIALKPIAKTLSETLKILRRAWEMGVPCFCADLTVNPLLVEWNKNIAARIPPLPEMKIGVLESNGAQNYVRWEQLYEYHPCGDADFAKCEDGLYTLNDEFYRISGGIFTPSAYYDQAL